MPGKPGRFLISSSDGAAKRNLKCPFPEHQARKIVATISQILIDNSIQPVNFPVELLLNGDHLRMSMLDFPAGHVRADLAGMRLTCK